MRDSPPLPVALFTYIVVAPSRVDPKIRRAPSGVQAGNQSVDGSKVIRVEMPRATSRTQISDDACSSRTDIATLFWSGARRGEVNAPPGPVDRGVPSRPSHLRTVDVDNAGP